MFKKRFISMLVLLMAAVTGAWADTTVTWTASDMSRINIDFWDGEAYNNTIKGITVTSSGGGSTGACWEGTDIDLKSGSTTITFNSSVGKIKSIAITAEDIEMSSIPSGWTTDYSTLSWSGEASTTVSLPLSGRTEISGISGIVFTIESTVNVTGVTLAPTSATLTLGETETVTLIPTVLPGDATDKSVTWSSSNEAVATVADGVVTAVAAGEATITVTTTDGAKTATCAVTVAAPAPSTYTVTLKEGTEDATGWTITPAEATTTGVAAGTEVKATYGGVKKVKSVKAVKKAAVPVTAITLNKTETSIKVGATETLSVTAVAPDNATDKTYTWKTSDESKATVDQDGKVTAVAAGTVTIYAEANDGSGVKGNCSVTVTPATITVTWNNDDITGFDNSFTKDGVTITAGAIDFMEKNFMEGGTFTTTRGNFTKIEVTTSTWDASGTGWSGSTWTGNASSVSFNGNIYGEGAGNTKFVFTIEPTN
jgi:uncharacterized protein YjdB